MLSLSKTAVRSIRIANRGAISPLTVFSTNYVRGLSTLFQPQVCVFPPSSSSFLWSIYARWPWWHSYFYIYICMSWLYDRVGFIWTLLWLLFSAKLIFQPKLRFLFSSLCSFPCISHMFLSTYALSCSNMVYQLDPMLIYPWICHSYSYKTRYTHPNDPRTKQRKENEKNKQKVCSFSLFSSTGVFPL